MVQFVAENEISGLHERWDDSSVTEVAGAEEEHCFEILKVRQLRFKSPMEDCVPAEPPGSSGTESVFARGSARGFDHPPIGCEAQVVIRREHDSLDAIDTGKSR
jgi:hypothetical protein